MPVPSDFDPTAANNTTIDGTNAAEGCPPAGLNNIVRSLAAAIASAGGWLYSGTAKPAAVTSPAIWVDTTGGVTAYVIKYYDGTDSISMMTVNTTANTAVATTAAAVSAGAIDATALASDAVTTVKILDDAVTTAKIVDGAVTFAKLAAAGVVLESEGIASNDNDTTVPTSAAVKDYADANNGWQFLATADISAAASQAFTALDATKYDSYKFVLMNVIPASDADLWLRTSTDGGSTYDTGASDYEWSVFLANGGASAATNDAADSEISLSGTSTNAVDASGQGVSGEVTLFGPHLTKNTQVSALLSYQQASAGNSTICMASGARLSAADVDAVQFLFSTGNITSGTITMYGMKNA